LSFEEAETIRERAGDFLRNARDLFDKGVYDPCCLQHRAVLPTHILLNDIVMLTKIEDAYIGSRYLPRRYERAEVEAMLRFVEERFRSVVENA
jgi:HEPN domain-containing protein